MSFAPGKRASEVSESVVPFAPTGKTEALDDADPLDKAAQGILNLLHRAGEMAEETSQHALEVAQKFSVQLRAAENRIKDLEADVRYHQERADRAEKWLHQISVEIEDQFFRRDDNRRVPNAPTPQSILRTYGRKS